MAAGEGVIEAQPDRALIDAIEKHLANVRASGRDRAPSDGATVMRLLVKAAEPVEEARQVLARIEDLQRPGGCFSAGQGAALAAKADVLGESLGVLAAEGGPHGPLLGLLHVVYLHLGKRRTRSILEPEEDAAITEALRCYAARAD